MPLVSLPARGQLGVALWHSSPQLPAQGSPSRAVPGAVLSQRSVPGFNCPGMRPSLRLDGAGAAQPSPLPTLLSPLSPLSQRSLHRDNVTPATPEPAVPSSAHPGHPSRAPLLTMDKSSPPRCPPGIPHPGSQTGALSRSSCPGEGSQLSPVPQPLSPAPQPCSRIPSLQNLLEILWMQILAAAPCQELELQSREGSRLQAQRPPPSHSRPLESSLKSPQGWGHEWLCGTPKAKQAWGKISKSWDGFPKPPPI